MGTRLWSKWRSETMGFSPWVAVPRAQGCRYTLTDGLMETWWVARGPDMQCTGGVKNIGKTVIAGPNPRLGRRGHAGRRNVPRGQDRSYEPEGLSEAEGQHGDRDFLRG